MSVYVSSAAIVVGLGLGAFVGIAQAQTPPHPQGYYAGQRYSDTHRVEANGRCNGVSYGTGARRCGTRSGGPVGGISGRN